MDTGPGIHAQGAQATKIKLGVLEHWAQQKGSAWYPPTGRMALRGRKVTMPRIATKNCGMAAHLLAPAARLAVDLQLVIRAVSNTYSVFLQAGGRRRTEWQRSALRLASQQGQGWDHKAEQLLPPSAAR